MPILKSEYEKREYMVASEGVVDKLIEKISGGITNPDTKLDFQQRLERMKNGERVGDVLSLPKTLKREYSTLRELIGARNEIEHDLYFEETKNDPIEVRDLPTEQNQNLAHSDLGKRNAMSTQELRDAVSKFRGKQKAENPTIDHDQSPTTRKP